MAFDFKKALNKAKTEEDVKVAYLKRFKWEPDSSAHKDLRIGKVLFEFKHNVDLRDIQKRARVLAQAMHYAGRIYLGYIDEEVPVAICAADRNEACLLPLSKCNGLLGSPAIDWLRAPSNPDPVLMATMVPLCADLTVYRIDTEPDAQAFGDEVFRINIGAEYIGKPITISTVMSAWDGWMAEIGPYIRDNDEIKAQVFREDMMKKDIVFTESTGSLKGIFANKVREYFIPVGVYTGFWHKWQRPPTPEEAERIMASADRFKPIMARRMIGQFHTPLPFCRIALSYMDKLIPGWRNKVMYDPCAGTGNLQFHIGCSKNTWLSTLEQPDVDYLKSSAIAPADQCFQMDYLADEGLLDALKGIEMPDPGVILMNPPYGESGDSVSKGNSKQGIAKTALKTTMNMGMVSNEIFAQFMWRVHRDHPNATVCLLSKAKFMTSPSYAAFRKDVWQYSLLGGFCFPGQAFDGVKGKFPVLFTVWEPAKEYDGCAALDVINLQGEKIGQKIFDCPDQKLLDWTAKPKEDKETLPLRSPIVVVDKPCNTKISSNGLGTLILPNQDVQHNTGVFVMSSARGTGHDATISITPANFAKSIMMWAVRKLITGTWINDRDQYSIPHTQPDREWEADCLAFCLSHGSNQTSSLRDIEYDGRKWDVRNEWVVPTLGQLRGYNCTSPQMRGWLRGATQDGTIAVTLPPWFQDMSDEGRACIEAIWGVWRVFIENAHLLDLEKFKIADWDAGWWQIRNALKDRGIGTAEMKAADETRRVLADKLRPGVYAFGFLPKEITY